MHLKPRPTPTPLLPPENKVRLRSSHFHSSRCGSKLMTYTTTRFLLAFSHCSFVICSRDHLLHNFSSAFRIRGEEDCIFVQNSPIIWQWKANNNKLEHFWGVENCCKEEERRWSEHERRRTRKRLLRRPLKRRQQRKKPEQRNALASSVRPLPFPWKQGTDSVAEKWFLNPKSNPTNWIKEILKVPYHPMVERRRDKVNKVNNVNSPWR